MHDDLRAPAQHRPTSLRLEQPGGHRRDHHEHHTVMADPRAASSQQNRPSTAAIADSERAPLAADPDVHLAGANA
jgi:hypothetical protein